MKWYSIVLWVIALLLIIGCVLFNALYITFGDSDQNKDSQLVGGDKDEHGCIGSAGYSWCEAKQKCLRIWEEDCDSIDKNTGLEKHYCPTEHNPSGICTMEYHAVCGIHYNTIDKETYGNPCGACSDNNVDYWIEGKC